MIKNQLFEAIKKRIATILGPNKKVNDWSDRMREEIEKMGRFNSRLILMMK